MWANGGTAGIGSSSPPSGYLSINSDKTNTNPTGAALIISHARPASNHTGICVFAFCGGNVRTIAEDIDYKVYKQLMTPWGGSSISGTINGSGDYDSNYTTLDDSKY